MTDHPAANIYDRSGLGALMHTAPHRRATFSMEGFQPVLPSYYAVSFYFYPNSRDLIAPSVNMCVEWAAKRSRSVPVYHGDIVAVMHLEKTEKLLHIKHEWVDTVERALLRYVVSDRAEARQRHEGASNRAYSHRNRRK